MVPERGRCYVPVSRGERLNEGGRYIDVLYIIFSLAKLIQVGTFSSINQKDTKMSLFDSQLGKLWKGKTLVLSRRLETSLLTC